MLENLLELPGSDLDGICIQGAREHNLKNISLTIPRGKFVVVTGVSGSGKSTLTFDLLFAEGQRRFLDSMSAYARQFVEQLARPEVDLISGLPPTVSIEQRNTRGGGKSTVATVTEVHHFIRLLFARLGTVYCPDCQKPVTGQSRDGVCDSLGREARKRGALTLLAPVVKGRKGFHTEIGVWAAKQGFEEVRADGKLHRTDQPLRMDRFKEHHVEVVMGRVGKAGSGMRELVDKALEIGEGTVYALGSDGELSVHSAERACLSCGKSFDLPDPKMFSYNSSTGWCPRCRGFGELFYLPEVERGARADAIEESWFDWQEGKREPCPECEGARLNRVARSVRLAGEGFPGNPNIDFFGRLSVREGFEYFGALKLAGRGGEIARDVLPEIRERLKFLDQVGLDYLELGRSVTTLSGGEAQRIRLAAQLGSNLSGVLYILDEPTIGLHARDNDRLLDALTALRDRGNSLVVVEHDEETMRRADYVIDLGPAAGVHGGEVVAAGTLEELKAHPNSITGQCLNSHRAYPTRGERRVVGGVKQKWLTVSGASVHNLKKLTVKFPLQRFTVVTGVSGSGKSTLVRECLLPALQARLARDGKTVTPCGLKGHEWVKGVYEVDQSPVGRTPRSTPATYVGFFDVIRQVFAQTPEARMRGYSPSRFSFNSAQGKCPACEGAGTIKLEMNFLPPAYVACEMCAGSRYNRETLDVEFRGKNIAQVLEMSVGEAWEFFGSINKIKHPLQALMDTGLGYLRLGQISPTLSGGEAQRIKLVAHLLTGLKPDLGEKEAGGKNHVFILEEPTIGLHMADIRKLVEVLQRLVDAGHTVIVIEHNLDLIAEADWVIDLGPEGGEGGGRLVAEGIPERIMAEEHSHTGRYLELVLGQREKGSKSGKRGLKKLK